MKQIQKCMRRKIAYANKTGTCVDVIGEQYIELPRSLCDNDDMPTSGQKSIITDYYKGRYKDINLISNSFPPDWVPDSVILEGMFLINTRPLSSDKTMADYGTFILKRFIKPYLKRGCKEIHLLFDNPGQQKENPKVFEQARRDNSHSDDHLCTIFYDEAEVPTKWKEIVQCRVCKRALIVFLSSYMTRHIQPSLSSTQKFVTSGATGDLSGLEVTRYGGLRKAQVFESNVDESDTRIWLRPQLSRPTQIYLIT